MPIRMAKLIRSKNGDFVSRKGIPAGVREAYTRLFRGAAKAPLRVTKAGGTLTAPKVWEGAVPAAGVGLTKYSEGRVAEWSAEIDTRIASLRAAGKHEPASDIDTAVVDSLKALDPKRPIREADMGHMTGALSARSFRENPHCLRGKS